MKSTFIAGLVLTATTAALPALAQEGLATSSSIGGHNTIQQAPSGGRVSGAAAVGASGTSDSGRPTKEERELEQRNNAATQICKGC